MEDAATLQQLLLLPGFRATLADDLNGSSRYDRKIINHEPAAQQALHFQSVSHRRHILFLWHIKGDVILFFFFSHYNKFLLLAFYEMKRTWLWSLQCAVPFSPNKHVFRMALAWIRLADSPIHRPPSLLCGLIIVFGFDIQDFSVY